MQSAGKVPPGKGSLEIIEEATQLVRTAPVAALACYYAGTLPFVLAALFFWGDMSQSAFAGEHLVEAALGLALLFIWMKHWQACFAAHLRVMLTASALGGDFRLSAGAAVETPRLRRRLHGMASHAAMQPIGLFLLAIAMVLTVPFGWFYAFFQNLTVLPDAETTPITAQMRKAMRLARLWPKQNHLVLLIISGFSLFVFWNLAMIGYLLPTLLKTLFGIESMVTRSGTTLLNSTFLAAMAGLTYVCVDPLLKAVYTLRCFYGESLESGEDLKAELRQASASSNRALVNAAIVLITAAGLAGVSHANAGDAAGPSYSLEATRAADSGEVSPPDLDKAIRRTIEQRKYTWRAPRDKVIEEQDTEEGVLSRFFSRVRKLLSKWFKGVGDWLDKLLRKLFNSRRSVTRPPSSHSWMVWSQMLQYLLIVAAIAGLVLLVYKLWRDRHPHARTVATQPIQAPPDLTDQNIGPEQLPEDGWIQLARDLLSRGEWRLALRAFYLASLAHLAGRHLISLAKFKSNREYERELGRRAHAQPELLACFARNVSVFERVWYGSGAIDNELVQQFAANVDQVKTGAGP